MAKKVSYLVLEFDAFTTLQEAIAWVEENKFKGCICPCCGKPCKYRPYLLTANKAFALLQLYKLDKKEHRHYHLTEIIAHCQGYTVSHDFGKMKAWGFIEAKDKETLVVELKIKLDNNEITEKEFKKQCRGKTSGRWMITELGKMFVEGKISVYPKATMYRGKVKGEHGEKINIKESFKNHFDYEEMIKRDLFIENIIK